MGARFLRKSWFRLKPLIEQKVIAEPIWFKAAEAFPPLPPPDLKETRDKQNVRKLFPEEEDRRKVDEKYLVDQEHVLWETERGLVFGREELGRSLSGFSGDETDEAVAWKVALRDLKSHHNMSVKSVELDLKRERLLKLKQFISY